jgi:GT2 family glycosyltransferase
MKQTAVVILNWNGKPLLERFLPALIRHTDGKTAAIIVADNASTDDSRAFLKEGYPEIRIIELDKNYGFAGGYNKALESIDNEYVVLLNSDVEVTSGWLQAAVDYLDMHRDVAAVQPKILSYNDQSSFEYAGAAGGFLDLYGYPFCRGRIFKDLEKDSGQYNTPLDVFWASGACLIIRTEVYKQAGGLDANFFAHQEEIDLCWRLRARGHRIVCLPQSVVYHVGGATLEMESPRKTFLNYRNNLLTLYKNLPDPYYQKVIAARYFLDILAALHALLQGLPANAVAILKAWRDFKRQQPHYRTRREDNLRLTQIRLFSFVFPKSIVWQYYVKKVKTYRQLIK